MGQPTIFQGRSKAVHTKTRTGCLTCKARRVKCDEAFPICYQCERLGRKCLGYPERPKSPPVVPKVVPPKSKCLKVLRPKSPPSEVIFIEPSFSLFENERDFQYFGLFSDRIAGEMCPYFDHDPWTRMILQACAAESSIRGVAVAIGALGRTFETTKIRNHALPASEYSLPATPQSMMEIDGILGPEDVFQDAISHHQYALEQYDKAIKVMRGNVANGNQDLRTTLITCIIITCFESLHGNHESAIFQLQSGVALLSDWKTQQQAAESHPLGFSSPSPYIVEDFLVQTFGRMELHVMSTFDSRTPAIHAALKSEGSDTIEEMPRRFTSLAQARIYIDLIMRRLMHFIAAQDPSPLNYSMSSEHSNRHLRQPPSPGSAGGLWEAPPHPVVPLDTLTEHDFLSRELPAWNAAFAQLLRESTRPMARPRDRIAALTMRIAALACHICHMSSFLMYECSYDVFLPDFRLIVDSVATILETQDMERRRANGADGPGAGIAFSFEMAILPPLFLAAMKCRDKGVRRRALALLERYPRREGVWDSVVIAAVSRWIMELEGVELYSDGEFEVGEGVLTEEQRVRKVAVRFDLIKRRARMTCLQLDWLSGEWVEVVHMHSW